MATERCTVWHYTYSHNIGKILASRTLLPPAQVPDLVEASTDHQRSTREYKSDAKILFFSSNDYWEPSAYRGVGKNGAIVNVHQRADYEKWGFTIYRFGVDRSILHPWMKLKRLVHMPKRAAQRLEDTAREIGSNPFDWWGTLRPVPQAQWKTIEVLDGEEWKDFAAIETEAGRKVLI